MVRLQYAPRCGHSMPNTEMGMLVFPDYTQDNDLWIALQDYQHEDWHTLVMLLKLYNQHICHIIRSVDTSKLNNYWVDYEGCRVTLDAMIRLIHQPSEQCLFEENTDTQCQLKPALDAKKIKFTLFLDAKKNKFRQFYGAN